MADRKPVTVPDIGDYSDVPVIEVLVADGDRVEKDQSLVVLESDKATMDVPAPEAGIVRDLKVKEGDSLSQGDAICELEALEAEGVDEGAGPGTGDDTGPGTRDQGTDSADDAETGNGKRETARASAQETGNGQRETAADADAESTDDGDAASEQSTTTRAVTVPDIGDYSDVPVIEVLVADGDTVEKDQSLVVLEGGETCVEETAPAAGTVRGLKVKEGDSLSQGDAICELEVSGAGKDSGPGTGGDTAPETGDRGPSASAAASAETGNGQRETASASSQSRPAVESPPPEPKLADGEHLVVKKYCHVGFAADTPNGLVVPVIRDIWHKGIGELAEECGELAAKARDGKLKPDEMKGGCFSISSLGGIGGSHFTPIVNAPEVGILGVSRAAMKPVWDGKEFQPRLMCPLSLSYDHRVIDGAYAARFIVELVRLLSDIRRLSL